MMTDAFVEGVSKAWDRYRNMDETGRKVSVDEWWSFYAGYREGYWKRDSEVSDEPK